MDAQQALLLLEHCFLEVLLPALAEVSETLPPMALLLEQVVAEAPAQVLVEAAPVQVFAEAEPALPALSFTSPAEACELPLEAQQALVADPAHVLAGVVVTTLPLPWAAASPCANAGAANNIPPKKRPVTANIFANFFISV